MLIKKKFKIKIDIRAIGDLLTHKGFTLQTPLKSAYEQCPVQKIS
ncbi:winged helix-turn-helix domain-containing protein [Microbulbifer sp. TRSA005]